MKILNKNILTSLFLLSVTGTFNTGFAGEGEVKGEITDPITHGEEAHKNHCYKCHTDSVYTRENRFVKSIDALSK
ncbi:MAG: hypothetical protein GQ550_00650, partial [Gammaproteobacteria bacterium]|nr:hypothetical protein [Gammaproteobacteria bacterium]